jgi:hypothetical protein
MSCSWELANICSHLCDETPSRHAIHTRNRYPTIQCIRYLALLLPKLIESGVQRGKLGFEKLQLTKQAAQKKPVMFTNAPFQSCLELRNLYSQVTESKISQSFGTLFTADDCRKNRSATLTEGVAGNTCEFEIGILEHFLNPACNTRMLP